MWYNYPVKKIVSYLTGINVLSWALAFVVVWFGYHEITGPADWVEFVPPFLGRGAFAMNLVLLHGIVLVSCGLMLVLDRWRRWVALIVALMIANIAVTLIWSGGLGSVAVRDIGLCGAAAALALMAWGRGSSVGSSM